jgi:hypothetical protein
MNTFFRKRGVDPYSLERRGLLIVLDAATLLSRFFKRGKLNPRLCRTTILKLLDSVTDSTGQAVPGTTVFGEMVAILWQQGREQVALELEAIWNELLEKRDFHLHCGYPKHLFGPMHSAEISSICDHHSISFGLASAA